MRSRRNGDVPGQEAADPRPPGSNRFERGDVVALTPAARRLSGTLARMMPRRLYDLGQPNAFPVLLSFVDPKDGPCVSLAPCCTVPAHGDFPGYPGFVDHATGKPLHQGHPEVHFEKIDWKRLPRAGDKRSSLSLPWPLNEMIGLEWREDERSPEFIAKLFGISASSSGALAKVLKQFAESANLI